MDRHSLLALSKDDLVALVLAQHDLVKKLTAQVQTLTARVAELEARLAAGVQMAAAAAEELTASIGEISRQVAKSSQITGKAVADARRTDFIVRALAEGAEKIGEVRGLIANIASQTNLLALNATIEAGRAMPAAASPSLRPRSRAWPARPPGRRMRSACKSARSRPQPRKPWPRSTASP